MTQMAAQMFQMSESRPALASCVCSDDATAAAGQLILLHQSQKLKSKDLFWRAWPAHQPACCCACPEAELKGESARRAFAVQVL